MMTNPGVRAKAAVAVALALLAGGCASEKSFALVSVVTTSADLPGVSQLLVEVSNGVNVDTLTYPRKRSSFTLSAAKPTTFSVSFRTSFTGDLGIAVTPIDSAGNPLGYGTASGTIDVAHTTKMTVAVNPAARPPVKLDGGAADMPARDTRPADVIRRMCEPNMAAGCGAGNTCVLACDKDEAVTTCAPAGQKPPGEACGSDLECAPGSQCLMTCPAIDMARRTCLKHCTKNEDCGPGAFCSTNVPCGMSATSGSKVCSRPCDPRTPATSGCAAGLFCFLFDGEVTDCDCRAPTRTGMDGAACNDDNACAPGFICVRAQMDGVRACRAVCRLDMPTCPAGRTCAKLTDPEYLIYGACLP